MTTFITICSVLNAVWFLVAMGFGIWVISTWTTDKIIQNFACKHDNISTYGFSDKGDNFIIELKKCKRCKKTLK